LLRQDDGESGKTDRVGRRRRVDEEQSTRDEHPALDLAAGHEQSLLRARGKRGNPDARRRCDPRDVQPRAVLRQLEEQCDAGGIEHEPNSVNAGAAITAQMM
jgi:hypothetical protein